MTFNLLNSIICGDELPSYWIFDFSTAHPMLFYSYIPIILVSFVIAFLIFSKNKKSLQGKLLVTFTLTFIFWVLNILVQWVASYHTALMFAWQLTSIFEVGIYVFATYFAFVFITKKDLPYIYILLLVLVLFGVIILMPTSLNIVAYDMYNCEGVIGPLWDFIYAFEATVIFLIAYIGYKQINQTKEQKYRKQTILFTLGLVLYLTIFFLSNFYGELTKIYEFNLWGPLGMVFFLSFFSYLVAKFELFNLKVFSTQILVLALATLVFSLLFISNPVYQVSITTITLFIALLFGYFLIKSVSVEVEQKEFNKKLVNDLKIVNNKLQELDKQKTEFVSFATHQLRSPLTAMKGYAALILDGDYGEINPDVRKAVKTIQESTNTLATVVDDYLNISRMELGSMKYEMEPVDFNKVIEGVLAEQMPNIEKSGVSLSYIIDRKQLYLIDADPDKFKQVIMNIVDNSIKYTPKGSVNITLEKKPGKKLLFKIQDTGIGMKPEIIQTLFEKFTRANNANAINIRGTGLGLYVAKEIIKAHGGRIWAESEGDGKGSQFYIEMKEREG